VVFSNNNTTLKSWNIQTFRSESGRSSGSAQDYFYVALNRPNTRLRSAKRRRRSLLYSDRVSAVRGARIGEDRRRRSQFH
jgi:hypothetical protein